jgi:hypothetical protein
MNQPHPRIRRHGVSPHGEGPGEQLVVREAIRICFYMPHDHPDVATGVAHAIDSYVRAVGEGPATLSHAALGEYDHEELSTERWERIHRLLLPERPHRFADDYPEPRLERMVKQQYETFIHLGGDYGCLNGYGLTYQARIPWRGYSSNDVTRLEASLPSEYLEEHGSAAVKALALDMASRLRFATGSVGWVFLALMPHWFYTPLIREEMLRHPGIHVEVGDPRIGTRVEGVHWLNFLGQPVLRDLGGAGELRSRLHSPGTTVQELDDARAVVMLGGWPDAGDLKQGNPLPAHRELARLLEPWLDKDFARPSFRIEGLTQEEALRWARRFLD